MMKIEMYNEVVTIRTMSDRAISVAIKKLFRSNGDEIGKVLSWKVKGDRLYFTHEYSAKRTWDIVKDWAQIVETAEVAEVIETAEVAEVIETAEVAEVAEVIETAEVAEVIETAEVAEVATEPTGTLIAEYIWTFTPTADGKTIWNSERVR